MKFLRKYTLRLYKLDKNSLIVQSARKQVECIPITFENLCISAKFNKEKEFRKYLKMRDFGYYAMVDGEPIGYGWEKKP